MKVLEGLISRWITRLFCIFATFPTRGPRGLLCYVRQPRPSLLPGRNPVALPGTRGAVGASLTFLYKRTQPFSIFLQSRLNESGRSTPHSLFYAPSPHLCGTPGLITWPHRLRISTASHFAPQGQLQSDHASEHHCACVRVCAVAPPRPTPPLTIMPTLTTEKSSCQLWLIYTINIR